MGGVVCDFTADGDTPAKTGKVGMRRRTLLTGIGAVAGCGFFRARPPSASDREAALAALLDSPHPESLAEALVRGDFDVSALRAAAGELALTRCIPDGVPPDGSVSHAVLGVAAARQLSGQCSEAMQRLLWVTVAWQVAREVARSPYGATPWHLPRVEPAEVSLAVAIRDGRVGAADAAAAGSNATAVAQIAVEEFGHLGHPALFASAARLLEPEHGVLPARCAARYLASHRRMDPPPSTAPGPALARVRRAGVGAPALDAVVGASVDLVRRCPGIDIGNMHLFTSIVALCQLADVVADAAEIGALWLDAADAGLSELGPLNKRAGEPGSEHAERVREVIGPRPGDFDRLVSIALDGAVATFHHSTKLVAAAGIRPAGLPLAVDFLASLVDTPDPRLVAARAVLGLT